MTLVKDPITGKYMDSSALSNPVVPPSTLQVPTNVDDVLNITKQQIAHQIQTGELPAEYKPSNDGAYMKVAEQNMLSDTGKKVMDDFTLLEQVMLDAAAKKYALPLGLRSELLPLKQLNHVDIILDDSGSMGPYSNSGLIYEQLSPTEQQLLGSHYHGRTIPRFEEQRMEVKKLVDVICSIEVPNLTLHIRPINKVAQGSSEGIIHQVVPKFAHVDERNTFVKKLFSDIDRLQCTHAMTPVMPALSSIPQGKTLSMMFSDGEPTDAGRNISISTSKKLAGQIITEQVDCPENVYAFYNQQHMQAMPKTLIKIGDGADWMDAIDRNVPNTDCIDDFKTEAEEIGRTQGPDFPVTDGMRLIKALRPDMQCLDKLDEDIISHPLLEQVTGMKFAKAEYAQFYQGAIQHQQRLHGGVQGLTHALHHNMQPPSYGAGVQQYSYQAPSAPPMPQYGAYGQPYQAPAPGAYPGQTGYLPAPGTGHPYR